MKTNITSFPERVIILWRRLKQELNEAVKCTKSHKMIVSCFPFMDELVFGSVTRCTCDHQAPVWVQNLPSSSLGFGVWTEVLSGGMILLFT